MIAILAVWFAVGTVAFGIVVRNEALGKSSFGPIGRIAYQIASIPQTIRMLTRPDPMMAEEGGTRFEGRDGWSFTGDPVAIPGYLALSRYDGDARRHVVELVDLSDFSTVFTWRPDAEKLYEGLPPGVNYGAGTITNERFRLIHPLVFPNGDILVKDHGTALVRMDACGGRVWATTEIFDHSTELGPDGHMWIGGPNRTPSVRVGDPKFTDDSLIEVSTDGEVLSYHSSAGHLIDNGYAFLVGGMANIPDNDPIHLNDVQPVLSDGPWWKKGDLFVSIRHKSTVYLYRPSTQEVVWLKSGPWLFQHDVDVLDDNRIAIFNNNLNRAQLPGRPDTLSNLMIYDFRTDTVTEHFADAVQGTGMRTPSEGLAEYLPSGHVIAEEENYGRLLVFAPDGSLAAEYVNGGEDGKAYRMGWSRYIPQAEGDRIRASLAGVSCGGD